MPKKPLITQSQYRAFFRDNLHKIHKEPLPKLGIGPDTSTHIVFNATEKKRFGPYAAETQRKFEAGEPYDITDLRWFLTWIKERYERALKAQIRAHQKEGAGHDRLGS
jgi:hypothetical protein